VTYFTLDRILLIKSEDGIEQMQSLYKQPENSIDALFVGSSHIFCHVNTGILWDEYGISGYDLAGAEQPFWNSYYYIKEALKTQRPKVIVLDITTPGIRPIDFQPANWLITNTYGLKRDKNRYDSLKVSSLKEALPRMLIPLNSTHGRYSDLSEEDFLDYNNSVNYKGFDPRETIIPFEAPDISGVTGRGQLSDKENEYLLKIIEYVKSENIPLLFISSPYVVTAEEQEKYNTIFDIADQYDVPYLDFNLMYDEMGLDFAVDIAEVLHLNRTGNEKFTRVLGQHLVADYALPDHRGDARYKSWDYEALYQRQDNNAYNLNVARIEGANGKFLDLLNNENYVIFISVPPSFEGLADTSLTDFISALGVNEDQFKDVGAFILHGGKIIFTSNEYDFKAGITDSNRRLLFYRTTDDNGYMQTFVRINGESGYQEVTGSKTIEMPLDGVAVCAYDTVLDKFIEPYVLH
ncbi:MAG: hypothetical protein K5857_09435, partial [Lachnospiraceae bacterium]|nr:hypothetical protein [Lachnospiraceae bacterium]